MGNKDAFNIAYWTEHPDLDMYPSGDVAGTNHTWAYPGWQQNVHALTGGFSAMERNKSVRMIETALDSYDLGLALHRLGDSYAYSIIGNEGRMYGASFWSFGHVLDDKINGTNAGNINERPWLYMMYTDRLNDALRERFGYKGTIDMFTFSYVAHSKGNTKQNSAILETEVRIRQGVGSYSVEGNQVDAINEYVQSRNDHFGSNVNVNAVYTDVDVYNKAADGTWVKTKSEKRTFVVK